MKYHNVKISILSNIKKQRTQCKHMENYVKLIHKY